MLRGHIITMASFPKSENAEDVTSKAVKIHVVDHPTVV